MTIFGIEGGIGTGKTITGVYLLLQDLKDGKKIYSNVKLKGLTTEQKKKVTYLTKEFIHNIFDKVKNGEFDMKNSTVFIQEAHNYIDSRNSASKSNKILSYWILQSRHTGQGSCDIIYDTQELGQVDLRLRRNTDFVLRPSIVAWEEYEIGKKVISKPAEIIVMGEGKVGHKNMRFSWTFDVKKTREQYDTHEIVDF